jgi:hypothetical protein
MTGRRPVYFQRPAWPVTGTKIMACACPRQAGRPGGLFGPLTAMYSGSRLHPHTTICMSLCRQSKAK